VTFSFRPYHDPGVDSASSENEYQEHFLGEKRPVREADNLTIFMCLMSWKSGSLNLLEPSGPHRACYGTALPLPLYLPVNIGVVLLVTWRPLMSTFLSIRSSATHPVICHAWCDLLTGSLSTHQNDGGLRARCCCMVGFDTRVSDGIRHGACLLIRRTFTLRLWRVEF